MRAFSIRNTVTALIATVYLLFAGCSLTEDGAVPDEELVGTEWHLFKAETPQGIVRSDTVQAAVRFTSEEREANRTLRVTGFDGCNFFNGDYRISASRRLVVSDISGSMSPCHPDQSRIADVLLVALNGTSPFEINGDELRIFGETTLHLRSQKHGT